MRLYSEPKETCASLSFGKLTSAERFRTRRAGKRNPSFMLKGRVSLWLLYFRPGPKFCATQLTRHFLTGCQSNPRSTAPVAAVSVILDWISFPVNPTANSRVPKNFLAPPRLTAMSYGLKLPTSEPKSSVFCTDPELRYCRPPPRVQAEVSRRAYERKS